MGGMITVRKVEPSNVHAGIDKLSESLDRPACWTQRTENFGLSDEPIMRRPNEVESDSGHGWFLVGLLTISLAMNRPLTVTRQAKASKDMVESRKVERSHRSKMENHEKYFLVFFYKKLTNNLFNRISI
jgi:hypothetical protein